MIGRIKRAVGRLTESVTYDVDWPIETEMAADPELQEGHPADDLAAVEHTSTVIGVGADYCADLVRLAIAQGGRLGKHTIPVHWLRMTLAGLEGRATGIEEAWEGQWPDSQTSEIGFAEGPGDPSYDARFRTEWRPLWSQSTTRNPP